LREYNPELLVKDRVLAITKSDMLDDQLKEEISASLPEDIPHVFISSFTQEGINDLKNMLWDALQSENEEVNETEIELPVLPDVTDHPYYQQFNNNEEEE
jgi:GTP-binding protein